MLGNLNRLLRKNLVCFVFVLSKLLILLWNLRFVIFCQSEIYRLQWISFYRDCLVGIRCTVCLVFVYLFLVCGHDLLHYVTRLVSAVCNNKSMFDM